MFKILVLAALFGCSLAIVCPPHICEEINCPVDVAFGCADGHVEQGRSFCGCCAACVRDLKEGQSCGEEVLMGVPDVYECGNGLECSLRTKTCQKVKNPCWRERSRLEELLQKVPGSLGIHLPLCDKEGNFAPTQCMESVCRCVKEDGTTIEGYTTSISNYKAMECKCARQEAELPHIGAGGFHVQCDALGNYEMRQCHEARCECVDRNGKPLNPYTDIDVSLASSMTCECARRNSDQILLGIRCAPHKCDALGNFVKPPVGAC